MPALRDEKAWLVPAGQEEVRGALGVVLSSVGIDAAGRKAHYQNLQRVLTQQGYTQPELQYAAQRLAVDVELTKAMRFGHPVAAADFERIIAPLRRARKMLGRLLTTKERDGMCADYPNELEYDHFRVGGYDSFDNPLWRFAPGVKVSKEAMHALRDLDDEREVWRPAPGKRQGSTTMSDLMADYK